jgi:DNA-binding PadR family transcriptional regulator
LSQLCPLSSTDLGRLIHSADGRQIRRVRRIASQTGPSCRPYLTRKEHLSTGLISASDLQLVRRSLLRIPYYSYEEREGEVVASKRLGRTQDPTILVLTSLTGGPKHGYAIIKDIEAMTGTVFGPGTLYGVLVRLEEEGLVEALAADDRRRPYRITGHGAAVLTERLQTSMKVATIGLRRLGAIG